ncbi:MAG: hypothetical protein A2V93_03950 [Ignavibacteria bacterium RBG_16_34_14]|nr:MAG: hypothetical protein A2V93_03950 [Ignavibacteria bacterium RBG_16_34_14]
MISKTWYKEIARDIIALGSIVFYFLVIGRTLVGPFWVFLTFLCSSALALLILYFIHKEFESYLARGIILAIGTSYFYGNFIFTLFATVIYFLMIVSSSFLGNSISKILKGIIFGLISTVVGYLISESFFEGPWY